MWTVGPSIQQFGCTWLSLNLFVYYRVNRFLISIIARVVAKEVKWKKVFRGHGTQSVPEFCHWRFFFSMEAAQSQWSANDRIWIEVQEWQIRTVKVRKNNIAYLRRIYFVATDELKLLCNIHVWIGINFSQKLGLTI